MTTLPAFITDDAESDRQRSISALLADHYSADEVGGPSPCGWHAVSLAMSCWRRVFHQSIEGLVSIRPKPGREIGTLLHACLARHYLTGGKDTYTPLTIVESEYPEHAEEVRRLLDALRAKYWTEEAQRWDIRAVEQLHEAPLRVTVTNTRGIHQRRTVKITSRFDLVVHLRDAGAPVMPAGPCEDGVYITDHKCLPENAMVDTANGRLTIGALARSGKGWRCVAWADTPSRFENTIAEAPKPNGLQALWSISTKSGRTARLGYTHPVLTTRGWVEAQNLRAGDQVALVVRPTETTELRVPDALLGFMGLWISNGCYTNRTLTKRDSTTLAYAAACLRELGYPEFRTAEYPPKAPVLRLSQKNDVLRAIEAFGVQPAKSPARALPPAAFQLSFRQTGILTGSLWSGDGACYLVEEHGRKKVRIAFASRSRTLCADVAELLRRLGILATVTDSSVAYDGGRRPYYTTTVVGRAGKRRFLELAQDGVIKLVRTREPVASLLTTMSETQPSGQSPEPNEIGIYWDKVTTALHAGWAPMYSVEVPRLHTFVAEGLVTHNTVASLRRSYLTGYGMNGQLLMNALVFKLGGLERVYGPLKGFILNIIVKTKTVQTERLQVSITPEDLIRFEDMIRPHVAELWARRRSPHKRRASHWPMNMASCSGEYGLCDYFDLCESHGRARSLYHTPGAGA